MENLYQSLGFKQPQFMDNSYGIRIYIGTKGKDDWCVEIPQELAKKKCASYNFDRNFVFYLVTEEDALEIAKSYTQFARQLKSEF